MSKRALITGITGQDGSYLAEWLLSAGYEIHGLVRPGRPPQASFIGHLVQDPTLYGRHLFLHAADLDEPASLRRALLRAKPDEIYHLAGPTHVGLSFELPEATCQRITLSTLRWLEMLRDLSPAPRFFQAASSEMFGRPSTSPQDETTPLAPATPYGCAVAFAYHLVAVYRATYGLHAGCGILFNHESPRRGPHFVTRKICRAAAAIKLGRQSELRLGDLQARRDWGHARDYVRGMHAMLQQDTPADYVFATGQLHTVCDVLEVAFSAVGLDWQAHVRTDPQLRRPAEPAALVGNATRARTDLGWAPTISFEEMIREMTDSELQALQGPR